MLILHFPTPKMLIIHLPTSNVWKNANHTIFRQIFKSKIEIAPKIFSFFFSTLNQHFFSNFALKQTFSKKKICMHILSFCMHNVVHDAQKLEFFPFLWITFFKQAKNSCFFVWHVCICLDQCLIS